MSDLFDINLRGYGEKKNSVLVFNELYSAKLITSRLFILIASSMATGVISFFTPGDAEKLFIFFLCFFNLFIFKERNE